MDKSLLKKMQKLARQNTGSSLGDSGGIYGYNYNRPLAKKMINIHKTEDGKFERMTISLPHFLACTLEETAKSKQMNIAFKKFSEKPEYKDMYWHGIVEEFGKKKSYRTESDNTYNRETDLDQDFQFTLFIPKTAIDDSYYAENVLIALQIHTGCDIRGGYSDPYFLSFQSGTMAESGFFDMTLGMYVDADFEDRYKLNFNHFETSYTSCPQYEIEKNEYIDYINVKKVKSFEEFELVLKDGRKVPAYIDAGFEC